MELVDRMLKGEQRALSRLISLLEREAAESAAIIEAIYPHTGKAYYLGVTGPPGAGKSTLVDKLTAHIRQQNQTVGIIAVDPTSPFSGGALLGDRIRMQQHYLDPGVFIRSLATKGEAGGLSRVTRDVMKLLDAAGKDYVIVETVGVGQNELDIVEAADTTIVILVPEGGDTIQTMKAGLMEIADIFVVNKADREGANQIVTELRSLVQIYQREPWWQIPVLTTQAHTNIGIPELFAHIEAHRRALHHSGQFALRRQQRRKRELLTLLARGVRTLFMQNVENSARLGELVKQVEQGEITPHCAAYQILHDSHLVEQWLLNRKEESLQK